MHSNGRSVVCHLMAREESKRTWFQPVGYESLGILELNIHKKKKKCKLFLTGLSVLHRGLCYHQKMV